MCYFLVHLYNKHMLLLYTISIVHTVTFWYNIPITQSQQPLDNLIDFAPQTWYTLFTGRYWRMDNEQLLKAISEMMDKKLKLELQPIKEHLDKLDTRMDMMEVIMKRTVKKLDDLQLDVKIAERDIRRDIHDLNDEMETVIEILRMNDMLPR